MISDNVLFSHTNSADSDNSVKSNMMHSLVIQIVPIVTIMMMYFLVILIVSLVMTVLMHSLSIP